MWWVKDILNTQHLSDFHIFNNLKLLPPPVKEDVCVSFTQRESAWAAQRERKSFRERRDRHQTVPPKFLMPDCWHGTFLLTVRTGSKEIFLFFFIFTDRKSELLISLSALLLFVPQPPFFCTISFSLSLRLSLAKLSTSFTINSTSKKTTTTNYTPAWLVRGNHLLRPKDRMYCTSSDAAFLSSLIISCAKPLLAKWFQWCIPL